MDDVSVANNCDYMQYNNHELKFGFNYICHTCRPAINSYGVKDIDQNDSFVIATVFGDSRLYSHEAALYIEDNWSINHIFKLNVGLRGSIYAVTGKIYPSLEPRVSARALFTNDL